MRFGMLAIVLLVGGAASASAEEVTLSWRLEKGAVLRYRHSTEQVSEQRLGAAGGGEPQRAIQKTSVEYKLSVLDIDPATGAARVLCRYEQVAVELEQMSLGRVSWDSRKREDLARAEEPAVRPFARLVGQEISFLLAPDGAVREVRGADKLRAAILAGLDDSPFAKLAFGAAYGDETLRAELERGFAVLPPGPVAPGATWARRYEQPVPLLGTLAYAVSARLAGASAGRATVALEVKLSSAAAATPTAVSDDPVAGKIAVELKEGAGEGEAVFSVAGGRLERSESRTRMVLATRLEPPLAPREGPGAAAAVSEVIQRVTVERIGE